MSAVELFERVTALPSQEQARFLELVRALEKKSGAADAKKEKRWPDFSQRLHRIYGDKIAPDSQAIIDESRGER